MENVRTHRDKGLTLIEILVSLLIVAIAVIGAMMYRYYAARNARMADVHADAGRVGLLILEGWKGVAGRLDYNPQTEIGPEVQGSPDISVGAISGGQYPVQLTGGTDTYYFVSLSHNDDVNGDGSIDSGIRKLIVSVSYYGGGSQDKSLKLTTVKISDFVRI
jgi:prepilin-type N-terminal cleavage/methylation domain-containing protein